MRKIRSNGSGVVKYINILLGATIFTVLLTFNHFPRAGNHEYSFHFLYNQGAVEMVSMFTRFAATPLLFLCKFVVKSIVYKGRTVIIKIPLVRHVMPKRELWGFLRRRAEGRSSRKSRLRSSLRAEFSESGRMRPEGRSRSKSRLRSSLSAGLGESGVR